MKTTFTRSGLVGFILIASGMAAQAEAIYSGFGRNGGPPVGASGGAGSPMPFANPALTGLRPPLANQGGNAFNDRPPVGQGNPLRPQTPNLNAFGRAPGAQLNQAGLEAGNRGIPGAPNRNLAPQNRPLGNGNVAQGSVGPGVPDLALADVRLADLGDPAKKRGLLFRITVRNVGTAPAAAFEVGVMANKGDEPAEDSLRAGGKAAGLAAGQATTVDVTLPIEALGMNKNEQGQPAPFASLLVVIDPANAINEADKENNGALIARDEIQLVELRIERLESPQARVNTGWILRGEGLSRPDLLPQLEFGGIRIAGQVVERQNNLLRIKAPALMIDEPIRGQLRLLTRDGKASEPMAIELAPPQAPPAAPLAGRG